MAINIQLALRWAFTPNEMFPERNILLPFEQGWLNDDYVVTLDMGGNTLALHFGITPL